ncbi:MAG: NUDIX domain-containing protein [Gammaproteobacteria bacterium]|nr:NUDIX domain-containing protein [Gammaproteobacteria bacterium]
MGEQIIEVDEQNNVIGLRPREDFYTGDYIHRSVQLVLFNADDEILLQHRSATKKWFPNLYSYSVSGTVGDESYEICMARELQEELGLDIPITKVFEFPFFHEADKSWHALFTAKSDLPITLDNIEMQAIRWISGQALAADIELHPERYTPPMVAGMKKFFSHQGDRAQKN